MRKSCDEVNHWGSQADSHVIKAPQNIRRRRGGGARKWQKKRHICEEKKALFKTCRMIQRAGERRRQSQTSFHFSGGLRAHAAAAASPRAAELQTTPSMFSQRWEKETYQPDSTRTGWWAQQLCAAKHSHHRLAAFTVHPHCILDYSSNGWIKFKPLTVFCIYSALFVSNEFTHTEVLLYPKVKPISFQMWWTLGAESVCVSGLSLHSTFWKIAMAVLHS